MENVLCQNKRSLKHTVRGRPRPHLPEFDEIQDHLRLSSSGFLTCMDKDQGGQFNAFFFSIFSSVGFSFFQWVLVFANVKSSPLIFVQCYSMWVSVFSWVGLSFILVLSCSCWLSFARCLLAAAVYGGALPSGMAERKRERSVWSHHQRERENGEKN